MSFSVPEGHTAAIAVLRGSVKVNGSRRAVDAELLVLDRAGDEVEIVADANSTLLLLSGAPIPGPIVGYGPFVMNSRDEMKSGHEDFPEENSAACRGCTRKRAGVRSRRRVENSVADERHVAAHGHSIHTLQVCAFRLNMQDAPGAP